MDVLYELIDLFPASYMPTLSDRLSDLFSFLKMEKGLTQEKAAERFLGMNYNVDYFNKLKNKLKRNLVHQLMIQPAVWANTAEKELCDLCHKEFTMYKILLASGRRKAAIELAHTLLKNARKIELKEIIYIIAYDLEYHYSANKGSIEQIRKYSKLADRQLKIIQSERIIRKAYAETTFLFNTKNSFPPTVINTFKKHAKQVLVFKKLKSQKLNRLIYDIIIMRYYVEYDYPNVIKYCNQALRSFDSELSIIKSLHFSFLQKKIPALIVLSRLKKAKEVAKEAALLVPKGRYNWHLILIQRIGVCFHAGSFQEAYDLYKAHTNYKCTFPVLKEYWEIIRAFLYFLIQSENIKPYDNERFNLTQFLDEIPIFEQDKAGVHINILVIQIMIELQREQYGRILTRIEALRAYNEKYIKKIITFRAYTFIQMIIAMGESSFHKVATERNTKYLLKKLEKTPIRMGQSIAVEFIPFEFLWNEILILLDNKFRAKKLNKKKNQNSNINK